MLAKCLHRSGDPGEVVVVIASGLGLRSDVEHAQPELVRGVLALAYRSAADVAIVALLDDQGQERIGSIYLSDAPTLVASSTLITTLPRPGQTPLAGGASYSVANIYFAVPQDAPSTTQYLLFVTDAAGSVPIQSVPAS